MSPYYWRLQHSSVFEKPFGTGATQPNDQLRLSALQNHFFDNPRKLTRLFKIHSLAGLNPIPTPNQSGSKLLCLNLLPSFPLIFCRKACLTPCGRSPQRMGSSRPTSHQPCCRLSLSALREGSVPKDLMSSARSRLLTPLDDPPHGR